MCVVLQRSHVQYCLHQLMEQDMDVQEICPYITVPSVGSRVIMAM